jgi:dolichol kinase
MTSFEKEVKRQLVHMGLGVFLYFLVYYVRKRYLIPLMTFVLVFGIVLRYFLLKKYRWKFFEKFLRVFGRPGEVGMGAMFFIFGSLISVLFFPRETAALSILVLGIGDGIATIAGKKSKHKLYGSKTLHGSTAFFLSSFVIISIINQDILQSLFVSLIVSTIELLSPLDDNIIIPPITALLLTLI